MKTNQAILIGGNKIARGQVEKSPKSNQSTNNVTKRCGVNNRRISSNFQRTKFLQAPQFHRLLILSKLFNKNYLNNIN